jgi:hypothetical protein
MAKDGHGLPKVSPGPAMPSLTAVSAVARLQGRRLTAVFYPFGHPSPYAYAGYPMKWGHGQQEGFGG